MFKSFFSKEPSYLFLLNHVFRYPAPLNLTTMWNFGFLSLVFFLLQIVTGFFLAMHYCSDITLAFNSIQYIVRDVSFGWLLRSLHANGASFLFAMIFLHIARSLYYRCYTLPAYKIWLTGLFVFLLMILTAFIGYVLPWGQMSYWGATVITNLLSTIPVIGSDLVIWVWGGFSVSKPTLARFFSLHYLMPFIVLILIFLHLFYLHNTGSSNPSFLASTVNRAYVNFYPYTILKDINTLLGILFIYIYIVFFLPDILGHSDNYIEANSLVTPAHIVPEWYFLPFYAILRSGPTKLLGVLWMLFSILFFLILPFLTFRTNFFSPYDVYLNQTHSSLSTYFIHPMTAFCFFNVFICLGWLGSQPADYPFVFWSKLTTGLYFILSVLLF